MVVSQFYQSNPKQTETRTFMKPIPKPFSKTKFSENENETLKKRQFSRSRLRLSNIFDNLWRGRKPYFAAYPNFWQSLLSCHFHQAESHQ